MLTLGPYLLFVLLRLDLFSFFVLTLSRSPTLSSPSSLNAMLVPINVFRRQTVSCVLGCGVYGLQPTHTTGELVET